MLRGWFHEKEIMCHSEFEFYRLDLCLLNRYLSSKCRSHQAFQMLFQGQLLITWINLRCLISFTLLVGLRSIQISIISILTSIQYLNFKERNSAKILKIFELATPKISNLARKMRDSPFYWSTQTFIL